MTVSCITSRPKTILIGPGLIIYYGKRIVNGTLIDYKHIFTKGREYRDWTIIIGSNCEPCLKMGMTFTILRPSGNMA